jgi:hypothetical protein
MTGSTQSYFLFDTIQYTDNESLGKFLDNLKKEQAIMIVTEALQHAFRNGLYDIKESEAISRSLRIIDHKV